MALPLPPGSGDLIDRLQAMLNKAGITDEAFLGGARISSKGYAKVSRILGVSLDEVEMLMRALHTRLSEKSDRMLAVEEDYHDGEPISRRRDPIVQYRHPGDASERFSFEVDVMKNVTIHDTETGKSRFLRGSEASAVLNRIAAGANQQQVLSQFIAESKSEFCAKQGAGCLIMAESTGRVLMNHRSERVMQPHTWGCWGGSIEEGENPQDGALREVREETGYAGKISALEPLMVFKEDGFSYHNYLMMVPEEFEPSLNWESQDARWCDLGQWPKPLHFGMKALFENSRAMRTIKSRVQTDIVKETLTKLRQLAETKDAEPEEIDEDTSFHDEIHASHGSYNFPWKLDGQTGYATARYRGRGPKMQITILSIRDGEGDPIEANEHVKKLVHEQAIAFIGQE